MSPGASEDVITIRLFGTPEVWRGNRLVNIPRRKSRALLYYLAAHSEATSRGQLLALFWPDLAKTPPDNQAALGNLEGAVGEIEAAVDDGMDPVQGAQIMDDMAEIARLMAVEAIDDAIARGGDAQQSLAAGDALRAAGDYKDALAKAEGA